MTAHADVIVRKVIRWHDLRLNQAAFQAGCQLVIMLLAIDQALNAIRIQTVDDQTWPSHLQVPCHHVASRYAAPQDVANPGIVFVGSGWRPGGPEVPVSRRSILFAFSRTGESSDHDR
ncbi:hypothetical protein ACU8V3_05980 [Cobetia marina]